MDAMLRQVGYDQEGSGFQGRILGESVYCSLFVVLAQEALADIQGSHLLFVVEARVFMDSAQV